MSNQAGVCMSPIGTERAVMRGLNAKAPSSAHFSTSQSLLLADRVVQATATSHLGPSKGTCSEALVTLMAAELSHKDIFPAAWPCSKTTKMYAGANAGSPSCYPDDAKHHHRACSGGAVSVTLAHFRLPWASMPAASLPCPSHISTAVPAASLRTSMACLLSSAGSSMAVPRCRFVRGDCVKNRCGLAFASACTAADQGCLVMSLWTTIPHCGH